MLNKRPLGQRPDRSAPLWRGIVGGRPVPHAEETRLAAARVPVLRLDSNPDGVLFPLLDTLNCPNARSIAELDPAAPTGHTDVIDPAHPTDDIVDRASSATADPASSATLPSSAAAATAPTPALFELANGK